MQTSRSTGRARAGAAATLALALLVSPLAASVAQAGRPERIVFARSGAQHGLYSIFPEGGGLKRLTSRRDSGPVWSPDGRRIAFHRWQGSARRYLLYVARADGSHERSVAPDSARSHIAWSPDRTHIAYETYPSNTWTVVVVELSTGEKSVIEDASAPTWSPDGDRIAFAAHRPDHPECGREIFHADPDGSDRVQVTDEPFADDSEPAWSPDGKRIAFVSSRDHDHAHDPDECDAIAGDHLAAEVYVATAWGGAGKRLTKGTTYKRSPVWSPAGARIAYVAACSIDYCDDRGYPHDVELAVVRAGGKGERNVTDTYRWAEDEPVWSPDGSALVHTASNNRDSRVVIADVRTGERTILVDGPALDSDPHWRR